MEIALFSIIGIAVYFLSDWLVKMIDKKYAGDMPGRPIVFFIIFFALILVSFELTKILLSGQSIS